MSRESRCKDASLNRDRRKIMLTARKNFYEAAKGGHPDRFVNQYEALRLCLNPSMIHSPFPKKGESDVVNAWGVTNSFPDNAPGPFPVHTPEKVVIKDITHWRDYVHAPSLDFPQEEWDMFRKIYDSVDTTKAYKAAFVAPGLFEMCHHLGEMTHTMMNLLEYEDEMHELIRYLADYEMRLAELICDKLHPDALFHHDDLGSRTSTFMSPDMWAEFYVEPYKEIYGYYKSHGCELIIHHSDSYAATLVPCMKEMGIDVWQGCMTSNNIPKLREENIGQIAFMGGFDGADYDRPDWNAEDIHRRVYAWLDHMDPRGYIPCVAQGGPGSIYDGVYETIFKAIDDYNVEHFHINRDEISRMPLQSEKKGYM
jgi:hypothetical protein